MVERNGGESEGSRHTKRIPTTGKKPLVTRRIQVSEPSASTGKMGMWLLIAALAVLFGAILVGYLVVRSRAPEWPPPDSPSLPAGLWISTALLFLQSALMWLSERAIRNGRSDGGVRMLAASLLVGIAFLGTQVANWMRMAEGNVLPEQGLQVWGFYVLSFLHAVHVLAGLVPMILIALRARGGRYTAADYDGVHLVGMYVHFLLATWIVILVVLMI